MADQWMRRFRANWWVIALVGVAAGLALTLVVSSPRKSWFTAGTKTPQAGIDTPQGELNAARLDDYLTQVHAGTAAYRAQRFPEATQAFATAASLQPSEPLPYRYLAELHWRAERREAAAQAVGSLAQAMPDAYFLDQVGRGYEEAGLGGLAMVVYRETVRLDPQFPGAHYDLGRMALEAGELERGIAEMQEAVRLHPDFPEAHQALGMAYTEQGRYEAAVVHLTRALELQPDLVVVRNHLGRLYLAQGRLEEAIQTFRALIAQAPDVPEAHHNLAVAYARKGLQELAIEQFEATLRLRPDFQAARLDLSALLLEQGRAQDAIDTLRAALTVAPQPPEGGEQPDLVEVHYHLGIAFSVAGQRQEAIQELETVLRAQPMHAAAHASLSRLYFQLRHFEQAWRHARRAESLGLPDAELLAALRRVSVEPP
jgi:tetratricopeptide (TPR) repeat protein